MKLSLNHLLLLALIYSNTSIADVIHPSLDISTPTTVTKSIEITADFGVSGSNLEILDMSLDITFGYNPLSEGETFGVSWIFNPIFNRQRSLILGHGLDKYSISMNFSENLLIDNTGLAYFNIYVIGGNGVHLTDITLTTNATVQTVPVPSSIILFLSGLLLFSRKFIHNKHIKMYNETWGLVN